MNIKYPRTWHLPWSKSITNDDKVMNPCLLNNRHVIITEKMDGENTTFTCDRSYARSVDSCGHISRNYIKGIWGGIKHLIPSTYLICGENMYAQHSIKYDNLKSYFYGFSIWDEDICLSWNDTLKWFGILGITSVNVIYDGVYNEDIIKSLDIGNTEGYVVRPYESFSRNEFSSLVGKYVRPNHVQTTSHWMYSKIKKNTLRKE